MLDYTSLIVNSCDVPYIYQKKNQEIFLVINNYIIHY